MVISGCRLEQESGHEAGRRLLRQLYEAETGEKIPEIAIGKFGKPYFQGSPWHFSITHTKSHAFCALSRKPVGIDGEELSRNVNLRLADKILSPGEKAEFIAAADPKRALLTFWVLKEAAVKLSGRGLQGYPNDTNFTLDDPRVEERDGCLLAVMEE